MDKQEKRVKVLIGLGEIANDIIDGYIAEPDKACNAINDAIAMLKGQEPKRTRMFSMPKERKCSTPIIFAGACPVCGCDMSRHWVACPICGQAVKWE